MNSKQWQCVDAGSDYCPCHLAEENSCIICTQLQGKGYCDCNWMGVCIYDEFYFSGNKKKEVREPKEYSVIDSKVVGRVMVLSIQVTKYMARVLKQPGSYVFVRNKHSDYFFDVPISIMDCDEEKSLIKMAIEARGIKTKKLMDHGGIIIVRGPYWNGIFGLNALKTTQDAKCLVLARGIAQAPAILPIKHLLKNNNVVDIIVNKRADEHNFIEEYFGGPIKEVDMSSNDVAILCRKLMKKNNYKLVFIGGSDVLQNKVIKYMKETDNVKFVTTNNNAICCGEGICGSCIKKDKTGTLVRTCKAQKI
ncbi:MAG: sulfide/dihydroorotate dehydrogenase-like FAD/NAD-binding protein [Candidatus Alkaliphilus sp. MAG34]|nr:sulfide/dihydroorotate dehydrogenase-like FAD/NAD-binding protein [Clostridiales bacterium]